MKTQNEKKVEEVVAAPSNTRELAQKRISDARSLARNARLISLNEEIRAAKDAREKKEKETGLIESPAVKAEREAEEKRKIEEASKERIIEHIVGGSGNALTDSIITTLNQVINYINGDETYVEPSKFKITDTLYYNETGRTDMPRPQESRSAPDAPSK